MKNLLKDTDEIKKTHTLKHTKCITEGKNLSVYF